MEDGLNEKKEKKKVELEIPRKYVGKAVVGTSVFSEVDLLSTEHLLPHLLQARLFRELKGKDKYCLCGECEGE